MGRLQDLTCKDKIAPGCDGCESTHSDRIAGHELDVPAAALSACVATAADVGIMRRQFLRAFALETGTTPGKQA